MIIYPTVVLGGASILWHWVTRRTRYYDHPLRQRLWRAGHAHAGVLLLLSLVALLLVDEAALSDGWARAVRVLIPLSAILLPAAYFLSIARADAQRPNRLVNLAYLGGASLTAGMLVLGVGLLRTTA
jgi:hypothetical protein